jgi:PAS domain S-box-containing protein
MLGALTSRCRTQLYEGQPSLWRRYSMAVVFTAVALSLTMLAPLLRDRASFLLFLTAVAASASYGGLGPALLSMGIAGLGSTVFLLPSLYAFDSANWDSWVPLLTFLMVALLIGSVNARSRLAQDQIIKILRSVTDGFIVFDTDWRYLYLNENAAGLARRPRKELIGTVVWEQFPDTASSLYTECHKAVTENTPRHFEYFHPPFEQWLEYHAYPSKGGLALYVNDITLRKQATRTILEYNNELEKRVKDRTQELEGAYAAMMRQIADRVQIEEALRDSEERFRSLAESANDAIVSTDSNGLILSWNRAADGIFGYRGQEAIGMPLSLLMPERYREAYQEGLQRLEEGDPSLMIGKTLELSGLKKDGTEFPLELSLAAWKTGDARFFSGIIRDITARKQAAESLAERASELARSNSELAQFAYVASHDLQEPLRMVASYTQLLYSRYDQKLGPEADYFLKYIVEGATRMGELIEDILAYSLFDPKKKDYKTVDCEVVLTSALRNLESTIQESGAKITHDSLPIIEAVPAQMTQVFQNLIGNAIKFRGTEAPEIHISAERPFHVPNDTQEWLFSVRDNGIGLPQEYGEQIFDVFKRLHLRHEYPGTGIGLAICKKVIEGHAGRIWVKSQNGKGSTFFFTIPVKGGNNGHP